MKKCTSCKKRKESGDFNSDKSRADGLEYTCKDCKKSRYRKKSEHLKELSRKRYAENRDEILIKVKRYAKKNRKKISARWTLYYQTDINFKLADHLRKRIRQAVKGKKSGSGVKDLGCSIDEFKAYMESKFYSNPKTGEVMDWSNYGYNGWHIDHIVPLASFDLTNRGQFLKACHYTNLQPLWAEENFQKGKKNGIS